MERFLNQVYQAICQHVNFEVVKALVIASPGFFKDSLLKFIVDEALKNQYRPIIENRYSQLIRSKILLVHSSSGHKHALTEILQDPGVQSKLADTKYAKEVQALDSFYKILGSDPSRAFYGYEYVIRASELGAIETLMVTDGLFRLLNLIRSSDVAERKRYIALVEQVKSMGGNVHVFSSLHTSGEQLTQLTGIASILHFGMPDLEQEVQDAEDAKRSKLILKGDEMIEEDLTVNLGE